MGRMYYASAKKTDERLIRILTTELGTVVLAMRAPEPEERGYSVGLDLPVAGIVDELLTDWHPNEDAPGWVQGHDTFKSQRTEPTFDVTILAAYRKSATERGVVPANSRDDFDSGTCKADHETESCEECGVVVDEYVQFSGADGKDLGMTPLVEQRAYADGSYGLLEKFSVSDTEEIEGEALREIRNGENEGTIDAYKVTWRLVREARQPKGKV